MAVVSRKASPKVRTYRAIRNRLKLTIAAAGIESYDFLDEAETANALVPILQAKGVDAESDDAYGALLAEDREAAFCHDKIQAAVHFAHRFLPQVRALSVAMMAGEKAAIEATF